jgi:hypothetical protein
MTARHCRADGEARALEVGEDAQAGDEIIGTDVAEVSIQAVLPKFGLQFLSFGRRRRVGKVLRRERREARQLPALGHERWWPQRIARPQ